MGCFVAGVGDFTAPSCKPMGPVGLSDCIPDECINPHPRFACLVANIRTRRGSKVCERGEERGGEEGLNNEESR